MLFQNREDQMIYKMILTGQNQNLRIIFTMGILIHLRLVLPFLVLVFASTQSLKFGPPITVRIVKVGRRNPSLRLEPSVYSS